MGHINTGHMFGDLLAKLGADTQFSTYLEVGTWNGQGSTQCIMKGILQMNPTATFYSLEANAEMYDKAVAFWQARGPHPQLHLLYGVEPHVL
jgi:predicted O-methyltransferase YrrM